MKKIALLFMPLLILLTGCQRMPIASVLPISDDLFNGNLVINDDFGNPEEEWCEGGQDSFGQFYCQEGEFHLINHGVGNIATMTDGNFKDFRVQAQMRSIGNVGSYGLAFRGQDARAMYYIFRLRPRGQYQLIKWSSSQQDTVLIPWTDSAAINKGEAPNQLEVNALGPQINLSVNNEQLANIVDMSFAGGSVGPVATEQGHTAVSTIKVWEILIRNGDLIKNRM